MVRDNVEERDNVELVDREYIRIPLSRASRKIKFKGISFKNISSRWNKFRLERLKKKLAAKKEKLVEMEFSGDKLIPGAKRNKIERRVLRKTKAIARLESKIDFMEFGHYHSEAFINSRAIKLKSLMMENLVHNRNSLYCVDEKNADEILTGNISEPIPDDEETKARIGADVRRILSEKGAKENKAPASPVQEPTQTIPSTEVGAAIDEKIGAIDVTPSINKDTVGAAIDEKMGTIDVIPSISKDTVGAAIDEKMERIRVSGNKSTPAKVNRFINGDGTYRLRGEDIDPEFRITKIDRSKLQVPENVPVNMASEPEISPFSTTARRTPDVDVPRKALTAIEERKHFSFPEITLPTIKEQAPEKPRRGMPIVVSEREPSVDNKTPVEVTVEVEVDYEKLGRLLERVKILQAQQKQINIMSAEAMQEAARVAERHRDTIEKFSAYANSLEDECNQSYEVMSQVRQGTEEQLQQIDIMISVMAAVPQTSIKEKARVR